MLTPLQSKLLEMFAWLTSFLEKNQIRYYAMGGTALGAARHEGFIPWDDDIDICVPRRDYERLIMLLREPIDHYVIETSNSDADEFIYNFAKFYDTNTTMTEELRRDVTRGVYIDIFPLDGLGDTLEDALAYYKKIDRMNMLLAMISCTFRKDRSFLKNCAVAIGRILPISPKWLIKKIHEQCKERDYDNYQFVTNCMSTYRTKEILDKSILGKPTPYKFENIMIMGPEKMDEYLSSIYREWRVLPPEEKRHSAHDFKCLNLNKPYRNQ